MKLDALRFDNPNNACQSLRILAEMVRAGDVVFNAHPIATEGHAQANVLRMAAIEKAR